MLPTIRPPAAVLRPERKAVPATVRPTVRPTVRWAVRTVMRLIAAQLFPVELVLPSLPVRIPPRKARPLRRPLPPRTTPVRRADRAPRTGTTSGGVEFEIERAKGDADEVIDPEQLNLF